MIKFQNCHIYPSEIEDLAMKHPGVKEIGVYGIPDPNVQELVAAVVVKVEGVHLSENDLLSFVNSRLEDFKHIRGGIRFVKSIPRNPQGKIVKSKLNNV